MLRSCLFVWRKFWIFIWNFEVIVSVFYVFMLRNKWELTHKQVKVQSLEESNPVPLTVNHMPLCCTFSFFNEGSEMVLDASYKEEKVCLFSYEHLVSKVGFSINELFIYCFSVKLTRVFLYNFKFYNKIVVFMPGLKLLV